MDNLQICPPRSAQAAVATALPLLPTGARRTGAESPAAWRRCAPPWQRSGLAHRRGRRLFRLHRPSFDGVSSARVAEKLAKEAGILCLPAAISARGRKAICALPSPMPMSAIGLLQDRLRRFALD